MVYDFHTHSSLSDGELSPMELIRRAVTSGYQAIAVTDHASIGEVGRVVKEVADACALARSHWNILAIPGIELTHVPAQAIAETARHARELGARVIVVHGETIVEPVEPGTNLAALTSPHVDILAHPGLLTLEEAQVAARNGVFLEISARKGHCLANGHVALVAQEAGARLLLGSDSHAPQDLLDERLAGAILRGAGLPDSVCDQVLRHHPQALVRKLTSPGGG